MLSLSAKGVVCFGFGDVLEPFVVRVTTNEVLPAVLAKAQALLVRDSLPDGGDATPQFRCCILVGDGYARNTPCVRLPDDFEYLADGDVLRVNPAAGEVRVLYRSGSTSNSLLLTERCNSFCVMCSQPPRDTDDSHLVEESCEAISLMRRGTGSLGLTGGEPLLLGEGFFKVVRQARNYLPDTVLHVLTNGRLFADERLAKRLAEVEHPRLILGIPLYSDQPDWHDFIVQAEGAFDETIKGILNLKKLGVPIELRVVIHRQTYSELPQLARFIGRNLTFVDYVALMGFEAVGFGKSNLQALWIDPFEYRNELSEAVKILERNAVPAYIYNHQRCIVDPKVRKNCVQSISDWKSEYLEVCSSCSEKHLCGGFFSTGESLNAVSRHIQPIQG